MAYSLFFGIQWGVGTFNFLAVDDYNQAYMREELLRRYNLVLSEISALACVAYDSDGSIRWWNISSAFNMTFIMLIQYTVIIYCAVQMYINMETKLQILSESLRNLHKQFFKTLILQIVTPTITLFSPVMFIIYLSLLDLQVDLPTGIFLCAFTLYPAMDANIVMYIVKDYRRAALGILRKIVVKVHAWLVKTEEMEMGSRTASNNPPVVLN